MIDGFPLSFFLPLVVHALAALTTGVTGVITFSRLKRSVRHPTWGVRYLWAYTVVFLTAILLSAQHLPTDVYLVILATLGYGFALGGYGARRFRRNPWLLRVLQRLAKILSYPMVNTEVKEESGFPFFKPSRNLSFLSQLFRREGYVLRRCF